MKVKREMKPRRGRRQRVVEGVGRENPSKMREGNREKPEWLSGYVKTEECTRKRRI